MPFQRVGGRLRRLTVVKGSDMERTLKRLRAATVCEPRQSMVSDREARRDSLAPGRPAAGVQCGATTRPGSTTVRNTATTRQDHSRVRSSREQLGPNETHGVRFPTNSNRCGTATAQLHSATTPSHPHTHHSPRDGLTAVSKITAKTGNASRNRN